MSPPRDASLGRPSRIEPDAMPEGAPRILGTVKKHPHLLEPMLDVVELVAEPPHHLVAGEALV